VGNPSEERAIARIKLDVSWSVARQTVLFCALILMIQSPVRTVILPSVVRMQGVSSRPSPWQKTHIKIMVARSLSGILCL
jgi:hypothetical protein